MAEEQATTEQAPETKSSKGSAIKAIIIVIAVLFIEGGTIVGTMMLSGGPSEVKGEGIAADPEAAQNKLVEVLVIDARFSNERTGRVWYFDTEIYVTVRQKHVKKFKEELETMNARVSSELHSIFRSAEPAHFREDGWATLTRQIKAMLDVKFGHDAEGEPLIRQVVISRCDRYSGD
jgi:flagellar basal body-associated protein FliL